MDTNHPNSKIIDPSAHVLKAQMSGARKPARLRGMLAVRGGQHCPPHCPPQPGAIVREPGPFLRPRGPASGPLHMELGPPLGIREVADLIGCSPWTVRQTLIPRGLPHFRFKASGRLTFYQSQVIRWIENQQQGGRTTK